MCGQWEAVQRCVHEIVVRVDYDFSLNLCYQDLKALLDAKEKLEEYTREMKMVRCSSRHTTVTTAIFDTQTHPLPPSR